MRHRFSILALLGGLSLSMAGTSAFAGSCASGIPSQNCVLAPAAPFVSAPVYQAAPVTVQAIRPIIAVPTPVPTPAPVGFAGPALALGACQGPNPGPDCRTPVVVNPGAAPVFDPIEIHTTQPMGHLRSVNISRAPHVNITRVHGRGETVGLTDAPSGFTQGCHPSSTNYCRQNGLAQAASPVSFAAPIQTVSVAGSAPRIYGSTGMVPGIAHIPTSIVNRDHATATAVLNSGTIPARPAVHGGTVPHPSMMVGNAASYNTISNVGFAPITAPVINAAPVSITAAPISVSAAPVTFNPASSARFLPETLQADGTYWEQTSGPTIVDGMLASEVVCKRQAEVVNPIIGVPQAVPTPLPLACYNQAGVLAGGPF